MGTQKVDGFIFFILRINLSPSLANARSMKGSRTITTTSQMVGRAASGSMVRA
jgi:hypothetical protein